MKNLKAICNAEICPYCEGIPVLLKYGKLNYPYKQDFGSIFVCVPCQAWVGCHKGTETPLGRLANKELRDAKQVAHSFFDGLWKRKISKGYTKEDARSAAYKWLAKQLGTLEMYTHIGMFDIDQCNKVVEVCKPYYKI